MDGFHDETAHEPTGDIFPSWARGAETGTGNEAGDSRIWKNTHACRRNGNVMMKGDGYGKWIECERISFPLRDGPSAGGVFRKGASGQGPECQESWYIGSAHFWMNRTCDEERMNTNPVMAENEGLSDGRSIRCRWDEEKCMKWYARGMVHERMKEREMCRSLLDRWHCELSRISSAPRRGIGPAKCFRGH
jgi:hypothetical protein